ncbi:type IV pilus assembly protein PilM [Glaciihabitans arcticus]|uniref:Type IV pilus assembly protein PilM n=1 Tax=Glaciihabitans arcticus TaxID=2668039 RepID=A0A4Q9GUG2_9MICO|nr:type IV pilus assembly protein PilM [Glaciihabitans arcticus]TBN57844.1 type IV pilus assembly protein PilM [Glaciihabitans arcticus]
MVQGIVGVDIGSNMLRAVEVTDAAGSKPSILRYHEVPLPEGAAASGEVLELNTVATALRSLWTTGGFKSKDVVLGMGNQRVLARDLTVPKMSLTQIREALPFQVQDLLLVPVADAILDFYPISEGQGENGPVVNGLLVAAVKQAVLANVRAVELAGLNPVGVDLIPFALNRVHLRGPSARGTVALIDVGSTTTSVIISTNGIPQFVRIIPAGGNEISRALATRLEVNPVQAEQIKRGLGLSTVGVAAEHRVAVETIFESANQLLTSLRNTLSYFVNARQQEGIGRILLSGGGSRLRGFDSALSEVTKLPVSLSAGFGEVPVSKAAAKTEVSIDSMSVALGLALGSKA